MKQPIVTVLMSVFNGERFLSEAVESILKQTLKDYEFLIIDDGSRDKTTAILSEFEKKDKRIRVISHKYNLGLIKSLNEGLKLAKGKYIARMDADDIALPDRLRRQKNFLDKHEEIALLGTAITEIDEYGVKGKTQWPNQDPWVCRWTGILFNPVAHPTVMMRTQAVRKVGGYPEEGLYCEDFGLWSKFNQKYFSANLSESWLLYRRHPNSVSKINAKIQKNNALTQALMNVRRYINCNRAEVELLKYPPIPSVRRIRLLFKRYALLKRLMKTFLSTEKVPRSAENKIVKLVWAQHPLKQLLA